MRSSFTCRGSVVSGLCVFRKVFFLARIVLSDLCRFRQVGTLPRKTPHVVASSADNATTCCVFTRLIRLTKMAIND